MNLRFKKPRASHSQTPIKKCQNSSNLFEYFSRPSMAQADKQKYHNEKYQKQNIPNNFDTRHKQQRQRQVSNRKTPKKKVIHLKSINRNEKQNKQGNSGSVGKSKVEHAYTEVTDFTGHYSRPAIKIDIDLKSHRRSMQETLASSNFANEFAHKQTSVCQNHPDKKATFIVKGKLFCDKCSVKLITKGLVAINIKQQRQSFKNVENVQSFQNKWQSQRQKQLNNFVQQLDKLQPEIQSMYKKLDCYSNWLVQYCVFQLEQLQQNWMKLLNILQETKQNLIIKLKQNEAICAKVLQQRKLKIREQSRNLAFMRNDIVINFDRIIDESVINNQNFNTVLDSLKLQLGQIHRNARQIKQKSLELPKIQIDFFDLPQKLQKCLFLSTSAQQLFVVNRNCKSPASFNSDLRELDPYRLSFGKESQKGQSPTFKII